MICIMHFKERQQVTGHIVLHRLRALSYIRIKSSLPSAQVHRRKAVQLDGTGGGVCGSQNAGGVHYFPSLCGGVANPGYVIIVWEGWFIDGPFARNWGRCDGC